MIIFWTYWLICTVAAFDKLEEYLSKFEDGPLFLGHEFSLVGFSPLNLMHAEFVPYKINYPCIVLFKSKKLIYER